MSGIGERTIRNYCYLGILRMMKKGGVIFVYRKEIEVVRQRKIDYRNKKRHEKEINIMLENAMEE